MIRIGKSTIYLLVISLMALAALLAISCTQAPPSPSPGPSPSPTASPSPKETIVFGYGGWDTQQWMSEIASFIVEKGYGYPVEKVNAANVAILQAIQLDEIDVHMEVAELSLQEPLEKLIESGKGEKAGIAYPGLWQGWVVPTYMIEDGLLPENPSVFDMPEYWELFKDPEVPTKGRFYGCIPGWQCEKTNKLKLEAYGLADYYNEFTPGSDAALSASMVGAYQKGEPWFGYYWSPTWVLAKVDMTPLEEPAWEESLWTEEAKYACAYPTEASLIVTSVRLRSKAPDVLEFLENYSHPDEEMNEALFYMQDNNADAVDAADWYLKTHESTWTEWVPADVALRVKAALEQSG